MIFQKIPNWFQKIFPSITWRVETIPREVYLTFDDGPHEEITPWVLGLLKKHDAKATFFCLGKNIDAHPKIFQEIIDDHHQIGSHTYSHLNASQVNFQLYEKEIIWMEKKVGNNLFRPPYGRLTWESYFKLKEKYQIVMWDVMSYDFEKKMTPDSILKSLKKDIRNGSIIVFHDNEKSFQNLLIVLPQFLEWLEQEKYICKSLLLKL